MWLVAHVSSLSFSFGHLSLETFPSVKVKRLSRICLSYMDTDDTTVLVFMFMGGGCGLLLMLMVVYYLSRNTGSKYADTDDYIRHTADKPGSYRPKDAMVAVEAGTKM